MNTSKNRSCSAGYWRVLLNLINNAFYAVSEKSKLQASSYKLQVIGSTKKVDNKIEIRVHDNGNGIPESVKEKDLPALLYHQANRTGHRAWIEFELRYH